MDDDNQAHGDSTPLSKLDVVVRNKTRENQDEVELVLFMRREYFEYLLNGIIVPTLFGLISFIGVLGNLTRVLGNVLVIYVIANQARMRTITNLLLLNVAVGDLVFVIIVPPLTAYQFATASWPFGDFACRSMHYVVNVIAYVTVYTLVLVAILRYMTIVRDNETTRFVRPSASYQEIAA